MDGPVITKSSQDDRSYRGLVLENQLQVLLISDPKADQAAAAMDVHVGYFCDPANTQGLAHFCEHMLFLGTEKFPDEKEYTNYLTTHGGMSNAFTSSENTNYYFDVSCKKLEGALDRFAQFFIGPLFTQDATDRELCAIDSEHSKNVQNDGWRLNRLTRSTCSPDHAFFKFGTGTKETLQKHEDIREQLLAYHSKYYSSNIMKLAILGAEDLDTLEGWAREHFSAIKNLNTPLPKFGGEPFPSAFLQRRLDVVPIKDLRTVYFQWPIPKQVDLWKYKPSGLVSHLIGHEGKGSILSLLKKRGWVNELSAGASEEAEEFSMFSVIVSLAPDGFDHVNEIATVIFQYIALLQAKGVDQWVFDEMKTLQAQSFEFQDKQQPSGYVSNLAGSMHQYDAENILADVLGPYLLYEFRPDLVKEVIAALTPQNLNMMVVSKKFDGATDKVEEWYGINYKDYPLDGELVNTLNNPEPSNELHLPHPNPFLPEDFSRHAPQEQHISETPKATLIEDKGTLWYKYDAKFNVPKAYQLFDLISPVAYASPAHTVMTNLFCRLVTDALNEYLYDAQIANLSYSLFVLNEGIRFIIKGYNCKQATLRDLILHKIRNIVIDPERFAVIKESQTRSYANFDKDHPYQRVMYENCFNLETSRWANDQYLAAIDGITLEQTQQHVANLFEHLYVELIAVGNISFEEAKASINAVFKVTGAKPLNLSMVPVRNHLSLPVGYQAVKRVAGFNPQEKNSAIEVLYQVGRDEPVLNAKIDLFDHLTSAAAGNQLRTNEQLGYIVWSGTKSDYGIKFYRVLVQSDVQPPNYLHERIEVWLQSYEQTLIDMSDDEFEENKKGLIARKLEKDKSLKDETGKYSLEIQFPRTHCFKRAEVEAEEVGKLTKDDMVAFFRTFLSDKSPSRSKLTTEIYGKDHPMPEEALPEGIFLIKAGAEQAKAFQALHEVYEPLYLVLRDKPAAHNLF